MRVETSAETRTDASTLNSKVDQGPSHRCGTTSPNTRGELIEKPSAKSWRDGAPAVIGTKEMAPDTSSTSAAKAAQAIADHVGRLQRASCDGMSRSLARINRVGEFRSGCQNPEQRDRFRSPPEERGGATVRVTTHVERRRRLPKAPARNTLSVGLRNRSRPSAI